MTVRDEAEALCARYVDAYRAADAAGCAACFTADAQVLSVYAPPATGRAAIEALHAEWTADGAGEGKTLEILDFGSDGALAWCLVRFAEGAATGVGHSLLVLQRDTDGWLIRICSLTEAD